MTALNLDQSELRMILNFCRYDSVIQEFIFGKSSQTDQEIYSKVQVVDCTTDGILNFYQVHD